MKKLFLLLFLAASIQFVGCSKKTNKPSETKTISVVKENGAAVFKSDTSALLSYQYETTYPPAGVDSLYARSAYIHPLYTPNGQRLTRIQPDDHYHHYGIWNPWTHVLFEGDTLDFWNLKKGHGTVRFVEFDTLVSNEEKSTIRAVEEHVVFRDSSELVALIETKTITISQVKDSSYVADIQIDMECATESPFLILEYRYAGFGWRTTEEWHKGNSEVFTSEVATRNDVDGTTGRWCVVQGELGADYGGVVMMSHPQNYNYPEPLRVWPAGEDSRGDLFANFSPTKNKDWLLEPDNTYTLNYRLLIFNGKMTSEKAEAAWMNFTKK